MKKQAFRAHRAMVREMQTIIAYDVLGSGLDAHVAGQRVDRPTAIRLVGEAATGGLKGMWRSDSRDIFAERLVGLAEAKFGHCVSDEMAGSKFGKGRNPDGHLTGNPVQVKAYLAFAR